VEHKDGEAGKEKEKKTSRGVEQYYALHSAI
jgi:hypothetical protein